MIKKKEIGNIYTVKVNGLDFVATISEDPSQYKFYQSLGLDVFESDERELIKAELSALGIKYRENSKLDTLQKKLDDYSEGNGEHESNSDGLGELSDAE